MQQSEVIEAPHIQNSGSAGDPRWRAEYEAFLRMLPQLLTTYRDKFVAIHKGTVAAVADNFKDAALEAYKRVGYLPLHVGQVTDVPHAPMRLPSPRIKSPAASA